MHYAIAATKLNKELGYTPSDTFEQVLVATIDWYLSNEKLLTNITSGENEQYHNEIIINRQ